MLLKEGLIIACLFLFQKLTENTKVDWYFDASKSISLIDKNRVKQYDSICIDKISPNQVAIRIVYFCKDAVESSGDLKLKQFQNYSLND